MTRGVVSLILCGGVAVLGSACATKDFVEQQVNVSEAKLAQRITTTQSGLSARADGQDTRLRETADRASENRQAIATAGQRLHRLDAQVGQVGEVATAARSRADVATAAAVDAETRLGQRLAGRNKYRVVDTKVVYFDTGRTEVRNQDVAGLDELAKVLTADPNAVLELHGFTDPQGSDRYNRELARDRTDAVMRYLVQRHGIELRQLLAISMGKATPAPGTKLTPEVLAQARRVELRLLAPWSSWEDAAALPLQSRSPAAGSPRSDAARRPAPAVARPVAPPSRRLPDVLRTITPNDLGVND
jgi:outer membrane protein OmpA-like peptidoglycan-associated protein